MSTKQNHQDQQQFPEIESQAALKFPRRKFLSAMAAGAGSVALSACGGGGAESDLADATAKSAEIEATAKAATTGQKLFYGINGHMAYNSGIYSYVTQANQVKILKDLGATVYRADVASGGMAQVLATALNGAFKGSGIIILPVLNPRSAGYDVKSSESAAYTLGYNLAVNCTRPLKGLVKYIECGNELDVALKIGGDGSATTDWNASYWPSFRGVIRGMIDGVKAIDSSIQVGVNVGIPMAYRALQMLWNGISPNGTAAGRGGAALVRWDFTTYHWYKSSYNIQRAGRTASVDVLQILKDSFGKPIWLTEFGWSGSQDTNASAAAYVTSAMTQYKSVKDKYNIQCVMLYAVIDDNYGLVKTDGVTKTAAYDAFKNFTRANPV
ncbi:Glycosyl hydrolase catalytic core [Caballeronia telluris]|uniref:Glycosyl hydrolase catalytic core n=2 Tax=Caballeronia telluris TaxID=326475 RepID=A0A158GR25_9BURK|nr:Glycosyl hydrolase catalytic core [Caballeronia telluris]